MKVRLLNFLRSFVIVSSCGIMSFSAALRAKVDRKDCESIIALMSKGKADASATTRLCDEVQARGALNDVNNRFSNDDRQLMALAAHVWEIQSSMKSSSLSKTDLLLPWDAQLLEQIKVTHKKQNAVAGDADDSENQNDVVVGSTLGKFFRSPKGTIFVIALVGGVWYAYNMVTGDYLPLSDIANNSTGIASKTNTIFQFPQIIKTVGVAGGLAVYNITNSLAAWFAKPWSASSNVTQTPTPVATAQSAQTSKRSVKVRKMSQRSVMRVEEDEEDSAQPTQQSMTVEEDGNDTTEVKGSATQPTPTPVETAQPTPTPSAQPTPVATAQPTPTLTQEPKPEDNESETEKAEGSELKVENDAANNGTSFLQSAKNAASWTYDACRRVARAPLNSWSNHISKK